MLGNRPEFHIVDLAVAMLGATPFSIYVTYPPEEIRYLMGDAGSTVAATSLRIVAAVADSGSGPGRKRSRVRINADAVPASIPPGVFDFAPCKRE